jgi:hypothetical protein
MKKLLLSIVAVAALVSCGSVVLAQSTTSKSHFEGQTITGVEVSSIFEVTLVKSNQTRAVVEVERDIEPYVRISRDGAGIVSIGVRDLHGSEQRAWNRLTNNRKVTMRLTLYLPGINTIRMSGVTALSTADVFTGQNLDILMSGVSKIRGRFDVTSAQAKLQVSGVSEIEDMVLPSTTDLVVLISGTSKITLNVPKAGYSRLGLSGVTNLRLTGVGSQGNWSVSGSSRLDAEGFTARELNLNVSGAARAGVNVAGAGADLTATVSGSSNASIAASGVGLAKIDVSGAASVRITGNGERGNWSASGSGRIDGEEFSLRELTVGASGAASARVNVSGTLNTKTSGSASIRYRGTPASIISSDGAVRPL